MAHDPVVGSAEHAPYPIHEFEPLFSETEDTIRDRILDPFVTDPDPERRHSTRQGGFLHDFATVVSLEFFRAYERLNMAAATAFMVGAYGDYLDQKGVELNLPRKPSAPASVNITVEGEPGTLIPAGSRFTTTSTGDEEEVPIEFASVDDVTISASGVGLVYCQAVVPGALANVAAHAVNQMVDIVDGIVYVTNEFEAYGGVDDEDDDEYRGRLIDALRAAGGPGNKADYRVWAREVLGVGEAIVFPHWDGGGTVKVVVIGPEVTIPSTATVRAVQDYLDPSVALLASMDPDEPWLGGTFTQVSKTEGITSLQVDAAATVTTTARLERSDALAYISSSDVFSVWADVVTDPVNLTSITFRVIDDGLQEATYSLDNSDVSQGPQSLTWTLADMTVPSGFDWGNLRAFEIDVVSGAGGASSVRFDALRARDANGGVGQGKAPIGAQVTVVAARLLPLTVSANIIPSAGYSLPVIEPVLRERLSTYLSNRRATTGYIYLSEIANVINDTPGVLTYYNVELQGAAADLGVEAQDVPILDTLDLT